MNLRKVNKQILRFIEVSHPFRKNIDYLAKVIIRIAGKKFIQESEAFATLFFGGKSSQRELVVLAERHSTDKDSLTHQSKFEWQTHSYCKFYDLIFASIKFKAINIFECGIGTTSPDFPSNMGVSGTPGASLRMWRDYFVNADIYGADIDPDVLFEEARIKTYHLDQTSKMSIETMWDQIGVVEFDVMIDDGLHSPLGGITLLENSLHKLSRDGIYIIEDVSIRHFQTYEERLNKLPIVYDLIVLGRRSESSLDNNLIIIRKG